MNIELIKKHSSKPELYDKGSSVMWTDPYISKRLLELHVDTDHDIASRSMAKIKHIVKWILNQTDKSKMKILDLGCGPGLYAEYLAYEGHSVTGIDFSENSIQYAMSRAKEKQLGIEYLKTDYLDLDFENQFDLVIMIYLDFGVLLPEERDRLLHNVYKALIEGGKFICDVINARNIDKKSMSQSWEVQEGGFWRNSPYIALTNGYHYPEAKVFADHHLVIGEDDKIDTYTFWNHYFDKNDLIPIIESKGFTDIECHENVLQGGGLWDGDDVAFYVSTK